MPRTVSEHQDTLSRAKALQPKLVKLRRQIHSHPELSFKERETARLITNTLFELGYEAVGELDPRGETVADWKEPFREGVVYYLSGGRVRGVLLWNTWGQVDAARALIADPTPRRASDLMGLLPAGGP